MQNTRDNSSVWKLIAALHVTEAHVYILSMAFLPVSVRIAERWFPATITTFLQSSANCIFTKSDLSYFLLYCFVLEYKNL